MVKTLEFIAEIGLNHNGKLSLAKEHVRAAKMSGATIAKFQTYFTKSRPYKRAELKSILENCELSKEDFIELQKYCQDLGIKFCSTPFCEATADLLEEIDCKIVKIASFHMNNFRLIQRVLNSKCCQTLIISTGLSDLNKIKKLDNFVKANNRNHMEIIYLHCISQYPVENIKSLNLINISYLTSLKGCTFVGYSDHSLGIIAATYSVILGSTYIEKHFTIDTNLPGADHSMSASPETFTAMVESCKEAQLSLGNIRQETIFENESNCLEFQKITEEP